MPPGDYQIRALKYGYRATNPTDSKLTDTQTASLNFDLQKGKVRWTEISQYEGQMLLPEGPGKKDYFDKCTGCHGFQRLMAGNRRDAEAWRRGVRYMRTEMRVSLNRFTDADEEKVASWLNQVFGSDSDLPASPEDLPDFQKYWRGEFSDEAMNIAYTVYDLPAVGNLFPYSGRPDKDGMVWMPFYHQNAFVMLDPGSGKVEVYRIPSENDPGAAATPYSFAADRNDYIWYTSHEMDYLGRLDPQTGKVTQYPLPVYEIGGREMFMDSTGRFWVANPPNNKMFSFVPPPAQGAVAQSNR